MNLKTLPHPGGPINTIMVDDPHPALLAVNSVLVDFTYNRISHAEALTQLNYILHNPEKHGFKFYKHPHRIILMDEEQRS